MWTQPTRFLPSKAFCGSIEPPARYFLTNGSSKWSSVLMGAVLTKSRKAFFTKMKQLERAGPEGAALPKTAKRKWRNDSEKCFRRLLRKKNTHARGLGASMSSLFSQQLLDAAVWNEPHCGHHHIQQNRCTGVPEGQRNGAQVQHQ